MSKVCRLWLLGCFAVLSLTAKADDVRLLATGEASLLAREGLIRSAKKSVDYVTYIFEPCQESTQFLLRAMVDRAKAGVRVRLLLDSHQLSSGHRRALAGFLAQNKIQLKFFNERLSNFRNHIKILLADDESYIVGGRNTADDYFGLADGFNFVDRDVIVRGRSASQVRASVNELWTTNLAAASSRVATDVADFKASCLRWGTRSALALKLETMDALSVRRKTPVRRCENLTFVTDYPRFRDFLQNDVATEGVNTHAASSRRSLSSPALKAKRASTEYIKFLRGTKASLSIENWSYIPFEGVDAALAKLREKKIKIRVITNSSAEAGGLMDKPFDHVMRYYAERDSEGSQSVYQLAKQGRLRDAFELTPKEATWRIHSKTAVRDEKDVLIGSYNIDPRSYGLNLEALLRVDDCPDLAADLLAEDRLLAKTFRLDLRHCDHCDKPGAKIMDRVIGWLAVSFL